MPVLHIFYPSIYPGQCRTRIWKADLQLQATPREGVTV